MVKRIAISAALTAGLFAGVLGTAGAAQASFDAPNYGTDRQYDAPGYYDAPHYYEAPHYYDAPHYYGTPVPGRYDAGCHEMHPGSSIFIGPNGVQFGLPGGAIATAGPGGVGFAGGC